MMKLSLRVTLLTILLTLLLATVGALGFSSYRNARFTADDLTAQILAQTALRIDRQLREPLRTAQRQSTLNLSLLQSGQLDVRDFPRTAAYWLEVMRTHPELSRMTLGLEGTGEWYYLRRLRNGKLAIGELRKSLATGKLELSDYWPEDYPRKPFYFAPDKTDEDARTQPWYIAARTARRPVWTEAYVFFDVEGVADAPGVTYGTPLYYDDGSLQGALTASFDLDGLCRYLRALPVGQSGYAFVAELRADGSRRVIAHPNPDLLLHVCREECGVPIRELVPTEQLADGRVQAFLHQLPPTPSLAAGHDVAQVRFAHDGVRYLGGYRCLSGGETPNWLIGVLLPEGDVLERVERCNRETVFVGVAVLAAAVLASLCVSAQVARPLEQLAQQTAAIGRLELEARPTAGSIVREVDHLTRATEEMKTSLRSFRKYVPADLVRSLLAAGQEARLGGENRTLTIYFSDIARFTSIAEELPPARLVEHLGEYLQAQSAEILAAGGTVDKYIGDAIMAFWGAPDEHPQHALAACTAAVRGQQKLAQLRAKWHAEGKPAFHARVGLHTGEVVVGNIGSDARLNYTVIGDAVNLASRLEGLNKYYGTEILISDSTFQAVEQKVVGRPLDWVSVKGKTEAVLVYELLGLKGEVDKESEDLADLYARALALYRRQDWDAALGLFEEVVRLRADDGPARQMIARCHSYRAQPPGESWNGVHRMESK
jgi:adenylate cyclase